MAIKLTKEDVTIYTWAEFEDVPPGDLFDYQQDIEYIVNDNRYGEDPWWWGVAFVAVVWNPFDYDRLKGDLMTDGVSLTRWDYLGYDTLGGVNYESVDDFIKNSGYYDSMVEQALSDLNKRFSRLNDEAIAADLVGSYKDVDPSIEIYIDGFLKRNPKIQENFDIMLTEE